MPRTANGRSVYRMILAFNENADLSTKIDAEIFKSNFMDCLDSLNCKAVSPILNKTIISYMSDDEFLHWYKTFAKNWLNIMEKTVFELKVAYNFSFDEIAESLDINYVSGMNIWLATKDKMRTIMLKEVGSNSITYDTDLEIAFMHSIDGIEPDRLTWMVHKLRRRGCATVASFLRMSSKDLLNIDGVGQKRLADLVFVQKQMMAMMLEQDK